MACIPTTKQKAKANKLSLLRSLLLARMKTSKFAKDKSKFSIPRKKIILFSFE